MEDLSRQHLKNRIPFHIEIQPYLRDHFWEGKVIFPAVEIMMVLARVIRDQYPQANLHRIESAQFNKMLVIDPDAKAQEVQIETEANEDRISASLSTSVASKSGSMKRTLTHAALAFVQTKPLPEASLTFSAVRKMEKGCINVPALSLYRELVPFGMSFRNITGDVSVSEEGALAEISAGGKACESLLGSPFVLDAAMHAACVWGQRFCNTVAFPVGFDRRIIYAPTKKDDFYIARVIPVEVSREPLIFNVWIFNVDGILSEEIYGLKMRDITGGRLKPPEWIREGACKTLS